MSRYTDVDALIEKYYKQMDELMESTSEHLSAEALSLLCGFTLINSAPTIDVVSVVHGEWIDKGWKGDWQFETGGRGNCWYEYECSECGNIKRGGKSNFCPNCGAKMDRESEGEK